MKKIFLVLSFCLLSFSSFATEQNENAYDRVIRTGTLRCGVMLWPPMAKPYEMGAEK